MAKRRKSTRARRDTRSIANRRLPSPVSSPRSIIYPAQTDLIDYLRETEDRRTYHPEGPSRPARSRFQSFHRLQTPSHDPLSNPWDSGIPTGVAFQSPEKVLVCVRRKQRKEVLHAIKKAGKRGQKAPRRSAYSDIIC